MKKISLLIIIFFVSVINMTGQEVNLSDYKYVVVPTKYYKFNKPDIYGLSSLTRSLFYKKGIPALGEDKQSWPEDLMKNPCLALYCETKDVSPIIGKNKIQIILKDCNDKIIYDQKGRSNTEEGVEAMHAALENAFLPIKNSHYQYNRNREILITDADKVRMKAGMRKRDIQLYQTNDDEKSIEVTETITMETRTDSGESISLKETMEITGYEPGEPKISVKKQKAKPAVPAIIAEDTREIETKVMVETSSILAFDPEFNFREYAAGNRADDIEGIYKIKGKKGELTLLVNKENAGYKGTVIKCTGGVYDKNSVIAMLKKTSLKNAYTVNWVNPDKTVQNTIGYLDENANLVIDIQAEKEIHKRKFLRVFPSE